MSEYISYQDAKLLEGLHRNDPAITSVSLPRHEDGATLLFLEALESNTVVNEIRCSCIIEQNMDSVPVLLNMIKTRQQLRTFIISITTKGNDSLLGPFLAAAAENHELKFTEICLFVDSNEGTLQLSAESWKALSRHPNLKTIRLSGESLCPESSRMIQQAIETCPLLQYVEMRCSSFGNERYEDLSQICNGIKEFKPKLVVKLSLLGFQFGSNDLCLLKSFLHECPNPVHLCIYPNFVGANFKNNPSLFFELLGPSVFALKSYGEYFKEKQATLPYIMHANIKTLKQMELDLPPLRCIFMNTLRDISNLHYIEKLKLRLHHDLLKHESIAENLHPEQSKKQQILDALKENISVKEICIYSGWYADVNVIPWTNMAPFQYIEQRNQSIAKLLTTPDLVNLSVVPTICQACPNNKRGVTAIFEGLRSISGNLTNTLC